ncbi:MAG: alcohol dehydrogenase [Hyphomicrobiaceae bacterium]|jgi:alcohol dehydrogenase
MFALKKLAHNIAIAVTRFVANFLPDRSPVTFIGPGSSEQLCSAIGQAGFRKCLIVTDRGLVDLGLIARITAPLEAAGVACTIYDGVEPDPTTIHVHEGLAKLREARCDSVLAVGGGSPMDAAKIIATMATNDKPLHKLEGLFKVRQLPLPLFAIPTTAGTGSEVTVAAVVSDPDTHIKKFFVDHKLIPTMTALDASLMTGLPAHITAATGMDALTHAVESFLAPTSTKQTEQFATLAVRLIFNNLTTAYSQGDNISARSAMALASYYAGMAFTRTGVGYVHAIAHNLGAQYGTPHGWANAVVLPQILDFSAETAGGRLAQLADIAGLEGLENASEADKAQAFIAAVREMMDKVGIAPTLPALQQIHIESIAKRALAEAQANYPVPRFMDQTQCEAVLKRLLA